MLNFVLCDDNLIVLDRLVSMFESLFIKNNYDARIGFKSDNSSDVLDYINKHHTDVLVLDINLKSDMSGLELAEMVRKSNKNMYFIFVTGHLEYSMLAYKVKTFDYLAKPITKERLEETLVRLFNDLSNTPKNYIRIDNKQYLDENDILYIKRDGMKLVFYAQSGIYTTYNSFNKFKGCLTENFVRCHKSYIVNIKNIINVDMNSNTIFLKENNKCFIGPKYKNNFMEVLKNGNFKNN